MEMDIKLPQNTLCAFISYVYVDFAGALQMGTTEICTDDLKAGKKICKGADGYAEE